MNRKQALAYLGRLHPFLATLPADDNMANELARSFSLNKGDALHLKAGDDGGSLYVLRGRAHVWADDGEPGVLIAGSPDRYRFDIQASADVCHVEALEDLLLYDVRRDEMDFMLAVDELVSLMEPANATTRTRAQLVRHSQPFRRLPIETIADAITRLDSQDVVAGQEIVTQGEPGDRYYVIERGEAEVWEVGLYDDEPQLVNVLEAGDGFGEEALVMDGSRSATVRMKTDGVLLSLKKVDFDELIKRRVVDWVDSTTAKSLLDRGYQLLDVRYEEEHEDSHIPGAMLVPLQQLRQRVGELDGNRRYVAYCKGGKRSAVAAMIMRQHGIETVSLSGGITDWPFDVVSAY